MYSNSCSIISMVASAYNELNDIKEYLYQTLTPALRVARSDTLEHGRRPFSVRTQLAAAHPDVLRKGISAQFSCATLRNPVAS